MLFDFDIAELQHILGDQDDLFSSENLNQRIFESQAPVHKPAPAASWALLHANSEQDKRAIPAFGAVNRTD